MRILSLVALLLVVITALPVEARRHRPTQASLPGEEAVLRDFEQILDLWRDGRYGELYERTAGGKEGKEAFARRLASAPRRPACCWEKIQEVRVTLKGDRAATVQARLGFEGNVSGTDFVTKGVKLKRDGEVWVIPQSELFSLANLAKKKARYKYLPIQARQR